MRIRGSLCLGLGALLLVALPRRVQAVDHGGADWVVAADEHIAGLHTNVGRFVVPAGTRCVVSSQDGSVDGGMVRIEARRIELEGIIDGQGAGFRGGDATTGAGLPGEGLEGSTGAGGKVGDAGGGGGAHGGEGGDGGIRVGVGAKGGQPFGVRDGRDVGIGSGGGAGARGVGPFSCVAGAGGRGGARVELVAAILLYVGEGGVVLSGGSDGRDAVGCAEGGSAGGGAGGSGGGIVLAAPFIVHDGRLSARGGHGGAGAGVAAGCGGGGGGGGRTKLVGTVTGTGRVVVPGGEPGLGFACAGQAGQDGTIFVETQSQIAIRPAQVVFPDTPAGESARDVVLAVENVGRGPVTLRGMTVSGAAFSVVAGWADSITLAPGESVPLAIGFAPPSGQVYEGLIEVTSEDPEARAAIGVRGRGLAVGMDVSASELDFGEVRVDGLGLGRLVTLTNSGEVAFQVTAVELIDTTDFQAVLESEVPLPLRLAPGESLGLAVVARPASPGKKRATITVRTDLSLMSTRDIGLAAEGVAPAIRLSTEAVHFGGVDVQAASLVLRTLSIANTGSAALSLGDFAIAGPGKDSFRLAPGAPTAIATGDQAELTISYQPTKESSSELVATLSFSTDVPGAQRIEVPLTGHGVDRHLTLSAIVLNFPATRRNQQEGSLLVLRVGNLGEAPLELGQLGIEGSGAAAFSFDPIAAQASVGPRATMDVVVEFRPGQAAAFDADLVIPTDDDANPAARVRLVGLGVLAPLVVSPGLLNAGTVAVGVARRIADRVELLNSSASEAVVVTRVCVGRASGRACAEETTFRVLSAAGMRMGPREKAGVALEFSPSEARRYSARLLVFVMGDPEPQFVVELAGEGIDGVVVSGGGCRVGKGPGSPWLLLLFMLCVARVRRRWAMVLGFVGTTIPFSSVFAERALDLATFRPAPGGPGTLMAVDSPAVLAPGLFALGLTFDHATNLLVARQGDMTVDRPVAGRTSMSLVGTYGILEVAEVGLVLPFLYQRGTDENTGVGAAKGTALGDLALHGKLRIGGVGPFSLAVGARLTLPTGAAKEYAGLGTVSGDARGIVGLTAGAWQWVWNVGFRLRGREAVLLNVRQGDELTYGLGAKRRITEEIHALAELFGAVGMGAETQAASPVEGVLGLRYRLGLATALTLGAGQGLRSGIGAPDLRVFALFAWWPGGRPLPVRRVLEAVAAPLVDEDRDGVPADRCPTDPEDRDGWQDEDGCPDADNDHDGLGDRVDLCPDLAEDRDLQDDQDGCPDADADGDGVPDARDLCADSDEDHDGFEDADGCDDPDNDKDGISDVIDACPLEPETINGSRDDDGCPDAGDSLVVVSQKRVLTLVPVEFAGDSAALRATSHNVLTQVARAMRARLEIQRLAILVGVAPRSKGHGAAAVLAQERAKEIRDFLVGHGVEPDRLELLPTVGEVDQVDFGITLKP